MGVRMTVGVGLMLGVLGCGGGTTTVYKGTLTATSSFNGSSSTSTTTGQTITIYSGGEGGALLVDLGDTVISMNRTGEQLTAAPNQGYMNTASTTSRSEAFTGGTGTLNSAGLTLNLTGTQTVVGSGSTTTYTFMLAFTGTKI
jgi:hypothetical protein